MATISIVTPSYRPDLDLCRDLHVSLLRFGPAGIRHQVIVPHRDVAAFSGIGEVHCVDEFLPRSFVGLPGNFWLNLYRPFPPVRGWIAQQMLKLAAASLAHTDIVLLVDSDMEFVRRFDASMFYRNNTARFFRSRNAVHDGLSNHIEWHKTAHRLLGLPPPGPPPLHDYICWPMAWDPRIVRDVLARVETVTGRAWTTSIGAELHFSEGILYGVYVDVVLGGSAFVEHTMLSIAHTEESPFDAQSVDAFVATLAPADIAVMISAKSRTDLAVRQRAIASLVCGRVPAPLVAAQE
jgi:hypothetical protein